MVRGGLNRLVHAPCCVPYMQDDIIGYIKTYGTAKDMRDNLNAFGQTSAMRLRILAVYQGPKILDGRAPSCMMSTMHDSRPQGYWEMMSSLMSNKFLP